LRWCERGEVWLACGSACWRVHCRLACGSMVGVWRIEFRQAGIFPPPRAYPTSHRSLLPRVREPSFRRPTMSAAAVTQFAPIFQTSRTAALIPTDARQKKHMRAVLADFADQFAAALAQRLRDYCSVSKSKTVTAATLARVAEDLIGAGAATSPEGVDPKAVSKVLIYSRFKKNIKPLRTDSQCSSIAAAVGFNFLLYLQTLIERAFKDQDPKEVTREQLVATLERPNAYSPSGLPCLAYRFNAAVFEAKAEQEGKAKEKKAEDGEQKKKAPREKKAKAENAAAAAAGAAKEKADAGAAPVAEKKARAPKKAKAEDAAAAVAVAPVAAAAQEAPKKRGRAKKEEGENAASAPAPVAQEAPAKKARKAPAAKKE
jgi:hypothetical protein